MSGPTRTTSAYLFAAAGLGLLVGISSTLGAAVLLAVGMLLALRMRPAALVTLAFVAAWFTKPMVSLFDLPRFVEFIDLPLVALAVFVAFTRAPVSSERLRISPRVVYVPAIAIVVSTIVNVDSVVRALAAAALLLEPLLAIVALDRVGMTAIERRRTGIVVSVVLLAQVPIAVVQAATSAQVDDVRGSLFGAGAGAHVMGSALLLGLVAIPFLLRRPAWLAVPLVLVAVAVAVVADAKTPLYALPVVFVAAAFLTSIGGSRGAAGSGRWSMVAGAFLMLFALFLAIRFVGFEDANAKFDTATTGPNSKGALAQRVVEGLADDPPELVYGFGPAQSVSRLAQLASPSGRRAGSPVEALGLGPATRFDATAGRTQVAPGYASSLISPTSSILGIMGDFGFLGLLTFAYAWFVVARVIWSRRGTALVTVALAGWLSLIPLGLAYDWPEQPPYTLLVALLVSLVTAPVVAREVPPELGSVLAPLAVPPGATE